jgi:hypothetical protein
VDNVKKFFQRIISSITDRTIGTIVVSESLGKAFKYLFIFMLLVGSINMLNISHSFYLGMKGMTAEIIKNVPDFKLSDGTFECQGEQPIVVDNGESLFVIDTTGKTDINKLQQYKNGLIITSTQMVVKQNEFNNKTVNFKDMKELTITKTNVVSFIDKWIRPVVVVCFVVGILFFILDKFINIFLISLLGLIVNAVMRTKQLYENILKLSIYAITPATILITMFNIFDFKMPFQFLIYCGLTAYYLYLYLTVIKKQSTLSGTENNTETSLNDIQ